MVREDKELKYGVKWEAHTILGGKCAECNEPLGVLSIRRHCRRCGRIVCSACQHSERVNVAGSNNPKIVCKPCGILPPGAVPTEEEEPEQAEADAGAADTVGELPAVASGKGCKLCGEALGDEIVFITDESSPLQGKIHAECFVCCIDGKPIDGCFAMHEGKLFCEEHYMEYMCDSCGGCGKKLVEGAVVKALGAKWHMECFVCAYCCQPLGGSGEFSFHLHNGAVYCQKDYQDHFCNKCNGCGFPVVGGLVTSDATWHRECFVCVECQQPIADKEDRRFAIVDGRAFCEADAQAVGKLTPEDRSLLQTLPRTSCAKLSDDGSVLLGPEDYGGCLSRGLAEALKTEPQGELQPNAFKERRPWSFAAGERQDVPFEFAAWAPEVFALLRQRILGIQLEEYRASLCMRPLVGGTVGEGKSGMLFYRSWDDRYIVKTCSRDEEPFFMQCLSDYYNYLSGEPRIGDCTASFLPRYLGLYSAKFEGHPVMNFIVMSNVFPPRVELKEKYDLKGVLGMQRFVQEADMAKGTQVLKDRNFTQRPRLAVGPNVLERLEAQIRRDAAFLQQHGRMDYSLLLGITAPGSLEGPTGSWPSVDSHGLQSKTGEEVYFMGIIDILQEYNWRKALEGNFKRARFRALRSKTDDDLITADNVASAASPSHYAERFLDFILSRME